jgi:hypothetical protein
MQSTISLPYLGYMCCPCTLPLTQTLGRRSSASQVAAVSSQPRAFARRQLSPGCSIRPAHHQLALIASLFQINLRFSTGSQLRSGDALISSGSGDARVASRRQAARGIALACCSWCCDVSLFVKQV